MVSKCSKRAKRGGVTVFRAFRSFRHQESHGRPGREGFLVASDTTLTGTALTASLLDLHRKAEHLAGFLSAEGYFMTTDNEICWPYAEFVQRADRCLGELCKEAESLEKSP